MPFPKPTPAALGQIVITLDDRPGDPLRHHVRFEILDAAGDTIGRRSLDLTPHLTAQQITQLANFAAMIRTKATAEIVGA